jgi:hypothetical protein
VDRRDHWLAGGFDSSASHSEGGWGGLPNSVMSAPAMKVRPRQPITIARTAASASARRTPSSRPSRT